MCSVFAWRKRYTSIVFHFFICLLGYFLFIYLFFAFVFDLVRVQPFARRLPESRSSDRNHLLTPRSGVILLILLLDYLPVTTQPCKLDNLLSAVQGPSRNFTV